MNYKDFIKNVTEEYTEKIQPELEVLEKNIDKVSMKIDKDILTKIKESPTLLMEFDRRVITFHDNLTSLDAFLEESSKFMYKPDKEFSKAISNILIYFTDALDKISHNIKHIFEELEKEF